ncbi:MAG: hypothetical protein ACLRVU_10270 [Beduini sp.]|uniref:hypothetical protein n=1 Tax=Beduini sp. TaxID=1922300 RepID=UPI0039A1D232
MKNKLMVIIFIIISICMGCFTIMFKYNDSHKWDELFLDNTITLNISDKIKIDDEMLYEIVKPLAQKYSANLYKNTTVTEGVTKKYVGVYLTYDEYHPYQIIGNDITITDMGKEAYVSTSSNEDNRQIGQIKDVFNDNHVVVGTMDYYLNMFSLNNNLQVRFKDISNAKLFFTELTKQLGINEEDIISTPVHINNTNSLNSMITVIIIISLFCFTIIVFYNTCWDSKRIGVLKLMGYDKSYIFQKLLEPIYKTVLITTWLELGIMFLVIKNTNVTFWIEMLKNIFLLYTLVLILSSISYFIVSRFTLSEVLKGNYGKTLIEKLNKFLRIIILVCCFIFSAILFSNISRVQNFKEVIASWIDYQDFAVPINLKVNNPLVLTNSDNIEYLKKAQKTLFDQGCFYVYNTHYQTQNLGINGKNILDISESDGIEVEEFNPNIDFNLSTININYLNTLGLKDMHGNDIIVNRISNQRVILLPNSKVDKNNYEYILKVYMIGYNQIPDIYELKFVVYDDTKNNKFFSFNMDMNDDGKYNIYSPIFNIITIENMLDIEVGDILATDINSRLKIPLNNRTIEEVNNELKEIFNQSIGMKVENLSQPFMDQIEMINITLRFNIPILILVLIIYVMITVQSVKLYIKNNLKTIGIKKLNGFSLVRSMKSYIVKYIIIDIMLSIAYLMTVYNYLTPTMMDQFHNITGNPLVYLFFIPMIAIDICFLIFNIKMVEKRSLNSLIKGDYYGNN